MTLWQYAIKVPFMPDDLKHYRAEDEAFRLFSSEQAEGIFWASLLAALFLEALGVFK